MTKKDDAQNTDIQSQLVRWAEEVLSASGQTIAGPAEILKRRAWSMVLQVRADDDEVYILKASPPVLRYEAALTQALARRHGDYVVDVIGADVSRGWLLMRDGGQLLREYFQNQPDLSIWRDALTDYARLQIAESGRVGTYLEMGLPDRRPAQLPDALEALIQDRRVVRPNIVDEFSASELSRLQARLPSISEICTQLDQSAVPASIDHGDFHDGNIFYEHGRLRFFDWGDSGVGYPFMSLRTAFVSVENTFGVEERDPVFDELRDAYLAPWQSELSEFDLRQAFDLARRVWAIPSALRWATALRAGPPDELEKYAHAVPSLLAELLAALEESRT